MLPDHEPDGVEKGIRFGCGFIFGVVFAAITLIREVASFSGITFLAAVGGIALVMGFLAMKFGDEFWRQISDKWRGL